MDGVLREDVRHALEQIVTFGLGLLQAVIVFVGAAFVTKALRHLILRRLAAALAPENAVENGVTLGVSIAAATLLLTVWGAT